MTIHLACSASRLRWPASEKYAGLMPTPVGPAPRDPNDPDFWDWDDHDDERAVGRHRARAAVAAVLVVALLLLVVASLL